MFKRFISILIATFMVLSVCSAQAGFDNFANLNFSFTDTKGTSVFKVKPPLGTPLATTSLTSGLIGMWPYNEAAGLPANVVGPTTATSAGSPIAWDADGFLANANGTDYIYQGPTFASALSDEFTLMVRIKPHATAGNATYAGFITSGGYAIMLDRNGVNTLTCAVNNTHVATWVGTTNINVPEAEFTLTMVFSRAGNFLRLYVNDNLEVNDSDLTATLTAYGIAGFAVTSSNYNFFPAGGKDYYPPNATFVYTALWNRPLSDSEVKSVRANPWVLFNKKGTQNTDLVLTDTGTGINRVLTIDAAEFRLAMREGYNGGINDWFDKLNDPTMSVNILHNPNPPAISDIDQDGIFNQVFQENDLIGHIISATNFNPETPRSLTVIENHPWRMVVKDVYSPMLHSTVNTNIVLTDTYYIYPNGKIYLHHKTESLADQTIGEWRNPVIGLGDPTETEPTTPPDTKGWFRCSEQENPYSSSGLNPNYIYAYWKSSETAAPYTNWTKASVMLVRATANPGDFVGPMWTHSWQGFKRLYTHVLGISFTEGQTIEQDFLIQLGTQGSATLPDIISAAVAGPIATAYQAAPTPP